MEKKSKKVKETKKVEKKEVKAKKSENKVVFDKETKKAVKIFTWILSFLASIVCIFTFVFSITTSLKVINSTKEELLHDNFTVTYLSNINGITITETEDLLEGFGNKGLFVLVDIVLPSIALIAITILLVILLKKILDLVLGTNKEKDLYTNKKLNEVEKMACLAEAIITVSFVIFKRPSVLLYIFVSLLLFVVIGLFKKCVENKSSQ